LECSFHDVISTFLWASASGSAILKKLTPQINDLFSIYTK